MIHISDMISQIWYLSCISHDLDLVVRCTFVVLQSHWRTETLRDGRWVLMMVISFKHVEGNQTQTPLFDYLAKYRNKFSCGTPMCGSQEERTLKPILVLGKIVHLSPHQTRCLESLKCCVALIVLSCQVPTYRFPCMGCKSMHLSELKYWCTHTNVMRGCQLSTSKHKRASACASSWKRSSPEVTHNACETNPPCWLSVVGKNCI